MIMDVDDARNRVAGAAEEPEILDYGFEKPVRLPGESPMTYERRWSLAYMAHCEPFWKHARHQAKRRKEALARPPVESWRLKDVLLVDEDELNPKRFMPGTPVMRLNRPELVKRFGGLNYVSVLEPEYESAFLLPGRCDDYPVEVDDLDPALLEPMPYAGLPLFWRARLAYGDHFHTLMVRREPLLLGQACERPDCTAPAVTEALLNQWGSVGAEYVCEAHALPPDRGWWWAD